MCIEDKISKFMMKVSKFEFFLINQNIELASIKEDKGFQKLVGINWGKLAVLIEKEHKFSSFDFDNCKFNILKDTSPQFLVKNIEGVEKLKWDSDNVIIDSWCKLLSRSFAQFRNNIAHGNKATIPTAFTKGRTQEFINAGDELINFITEKIFKEKDWLLPIEFKN